MMKNIAHILSSHYGIFNANISRLDGYANLNYKIELVDGTKFVLKEHHYEPGLKDLYVAEGKLLALLAQKMPGKFPEPVNSLQDKYLVTNVSGSDSIYRMLRWVEGDLYAEVEHDPALLYSFGAFLAGMDKILLGEYYAAVAARKIDWDLQNLPGLADRISSIKDVHTKKKVHYFMMQFNEVVVPELNKLRKSVIHNDANDWNLFVKERAVGGIIDFGDMVYAPLIQELAVYLTYALFDKAEPLSWAIHVVKGYHKVLNLQAVEIDLLYYFVAGRLCMSLINSAYSKSLDPDNEYLSVSEKQAIALLDQWFEISPEKMKDKLRMACGISAVRVEEIENSLEKRFRHISKAQSVSYNVPIKMKRSAFQYMYDEYGNTFLDAYNNIPHVGHSHPKVVEAGQRQMAKLNTNTRYVYDQLAVYSETLIGKFPPSLNKVFFVNSGSAASDLAIRMAQTYSGHRNVMVLEHGYHGHTRLGIDISHYKFGRKGGKGEADFITKTPIPDTYRGAFNQDDGTAGLAFAKNVRQQLEKLKSPIAAFIAEPVVGCAGQVPLAKDYLKHLYPFIRQQGGVCISDEVQTGFGRMGSSFWGFEMHEVIPDIVVLGKPMGNGHPMAAVVTTDEIANAFDNGMEFFSSFGGNPVSCAIGQAVLDVIEEEDLQKNALVTGSYFIHQLNKLKNKYENIGDVRGSGLFLGIEFVKDRETKVHDTDLANFIKNRMREQLILVSTDGPRDNIIKMKPPMCFNHSNVDTVIHHLDRILSSI